MTPRPPIRLLVATLLFISALSGLAAPANDAFTAATTIGPSLPSTKTGDALDATYQSNEVVLDSSSWNGTIWFKWSPTTAGTGFAAPTFTWTADGFGYEMVVYRGTTLAGLTAVARGSEEFPIERFSFATGQTYHFQIHVTTDPEGGSFAYELELASTTAAPNAPANDAFASATIITGTPTTTIPLTRTGTTAAATLESGESADSPRVRSVWYKYTTGATPTSAIRQFSLFSDSVDSFQTLEVFTGSTLANLTRIARVEDYKATLVTLAASTTYYLRVSNDDSYSTPGAFEIEIAIQPSGTAAANNNFASATNLGSGLNVPTSSNTFKSTLETSEKNPFAVGGTVWFRWTAPSTGWFTVSAESDDWPPALAVWSGTALANLKLRGAANSYGPSVTFAATSGETLYFQAGAEGGYSYPFEPLAPFTISVSADTDPGLPRLTSLTLSAASVNVTSASQSVTATLSMAGPEDGFIDALYLLHPNGGVVDAAFYEDITQISGTPGNGDFTATLEVPRGLAPGSYSLVAYLTKDFGDYLSYGSTSLITPQSPTWAWESHFDIPSGTDQITVTNTGTADTAPNLTSFTVSPTSGDVGTAAQTFNLSAVITDAQGVFAADVEYRGPDGEAVGVSLARTSGTATSGTWTGSFTIPRYSAPGRVNLTLRFVDTVGQSKRFGIQPNSLPLDDKFAGRLLTMSNATITLTNTAGIDIIPPQASEVTVTPNPATFALGGTASVTVSTRVKDALSGTSSVEVSLDGFTFTTLPRTSGTAADGIYSTVLNVDRAEFLPGVYALWISAGDGLGNISIFTPPAPGLPIVTLNALPGGYDEWSLDKNLSAPDDDPLAEPQGDGINNALKFASNLDPNLSITGAQRILDPVEGTSGLPAIRQVGSGDTARLRVTFLRRLSTPGLAQVVEFCSDPSATGTVGWTPATGPETLESINAQWQRVTVEDVEGTGQLRRFGRLRVEVTR